jgi:hypothetical protein
MLKIWSVHKCVGGVLAIFDKLTIMLKLILMQRGYCLGVVT